jgi:hypothetical protein
MKTGSTGLEFFVTCWQTEGRRIARLTDAISQSFVANVRTTNWDMQKQSLQVQWT